MTVRKYAPKTFKVSRTAKITRTDADKFAPLIIGSAQRLGSLVAVAKEFGVSRGSLDYFLGKEFSHRTSASPEIGKKILDGYRKIKHLPKITEYKI